MPVFEALAPWFFDVTKTNLKKKKKNSSSSTPSGCWKPAESSAGSVLVNVVAPRVDVEQCILATERQERATDWDWMVRCMLFVVFFFFFFFFFLGTFFCCVFFLVFFSLCFFF